MQDPHKNSCAYHQENLQSGLHKLPANRGAVRKFQGGKELGMGTMRGVGRSEPAEMSSNISPFFTTSSFIPAKKDLTLCQGAEKGDQEINLPWRELRMECYKRLHI